jgi:hypothetical protein
MVMTSKQIILLVVIIFLSLVPIISGILFLYWSRITRFVSKKVYSARMPHKMIMAVMHFPGNKIDRVYRIIPDNKKMGISNGDYYFTQDNLASQKELHDKVIFKNKNKKLCFKYDAKFDGLIKENMTKEEYDKLMKTSNKGNDVYFINEDMLSMDRVDNKTPEVHYWFNNPNPIIFDFAKEKIDVTAKDVRSLIESEVVQRLLKLAQQSMQMMLLIIIGGLNLIITIFILAKIMQWIK